MTDPASEIILHNYPQSPVAEKVRVAFGIKGLAWRDVEIPRITPKPMLTPLTGARQLCRLARTSTATANASFASLSGGIQSPRSCRRLKLD